MPQLNLPYPFNLARQEATWNLRRYGGSYEDRLGDAFLFAQEAVLTHDPQNGDLGPRVRFIVAKGLLSKVRKEARRGSILQQSSLDFEPLDRGLGTMEKAKRDVEGDAWQVLDLLDHPPLELWRLCQENNVRWSPQSIRKALIQFLIEMGWKRERIDKSFEQIREVLN